MQKHRAVVFYSDRLTQRLRQQQSLSDAGFLATLLSVIDYDGVGLCPRTEATNGFIFHPPDDM
jgi:hypothetical protein